MTSDVLDERWPARPLPAEPPNGGKPDSVDTYADELAAFWDLTTPQTAPRLAFDADSPEGRQGPEVEPLPHAGQRAA